jgi:predicted enzyme related to lactoylglutathione lyase
VTAVGRLGWIQVDCAEPEALGQFWSTALGVNVRGTLGEPVQYVFLEAGVPDGPRLCFQRVPEPKTVKNRLHLDLAVSDVRQASDALYALGATDVSGGDVVEHDIKWRVLADPEGNEFCVVEVTDDE